MTRVPYFSRIMCANDCGNEVGREYPATHWSPSECNLYDHALVDESGKPYCSEECYRANNPLYCKACKDMQVDTANEICEECRALKPEDFASPRAFLTHQHIIKQADEQAAKGQGNA